MTKILIPGIDPIVLIRQVRLIKDAVYQDDYWISCTDEEKVEIEALLDMLDDMKYGDYNVA